MTEYRTRTHPNALPGAPDFPGRRRRRRCRRQARRRTLLLLLLFLLLAAWPLMLLRRQTDTGTAGDAVSGSSLTGTAGTVSDAAQEADLSGYPEALQTLWEKNEEAHQFILDYPENKDRQFDIDLTQEAQSDTVPLLMQWDERWGYLSYSGGLFGCTGCGPTCLSMAALYLTGNAEYTPAYMAQYAAENGYAVEGSGTAWALMSEGAAGLGLTSEELPLSESEIVSALENGKVVICVLGPGDFTDDGHFIVLTGYQDGAFTVNDPNSQARSARTWTFERLSGQIKNLWALGAA